MRYFDSHAHYYDRRFAEECSMGVDQLISTLLSDSVSYIINVATSLENAMEAVAQAKRYANMYTALGVHPSDTRFIDREMSGYLCELEAQILSSENKCVALGEIGLDYHYEDTDKLTQAKWFEAQMALAEKLSLPVVIHDREAHGDCLEMIKNFPRFPKKALQRLFYIRIL